jgi:hypothetical protein
MAKEKENKVEETKNLKETKTKSNTNDNVTRVKMKPSKIEESITKVDLSKPPKESKSEEVEQQPAKEEEVVVVNEEPKVDKVEEKEEEVKEEVPVIQEVTDEEVVEVEVSPTEETIKAEVKENPLPEKLQKVIDFMNETGGDLNDYVNLNRDISKMDDSEVLDEYYRSTKSHLSPEERGFLLEDSFGVDEDLDDEKTIRKKKIALKEQVAEARAHLDRQKSKYYEDIKAGSKLTSEQQKAIDFFNRYNKESEVQTKKAETSKRAFLNKTNNLFNENFKGFDYQVGDKKFRFNVKDVDKVKTTQSDLNNFVNKFVGEDKVTIKDAAGYHKSLFTAMNADTIAKHFYEQGKADAIKDTAAKDKNINVNARQTHGQIEAGGIKVRVLGDNTKDFKFKIKNKK